MNRLACYQLLFLFSCSFPLTLALNISPRAPLNRVVTTKSLHNLRNCVCHCSSPEISSEGAPIQYPDIPEINSKPEKITLLKKVKNLFKGEKFSKEKIGKLGLYAALSYGFVSNVSYSICVSVAWYLTSKRNGLSPIAPGQWKAFLAIYASLFIFNNIIRPIRFALSVGLAPSFDKLITSIMEKTGRSRAAATGICILLVNICGTIAFMSGGILLASITSGVSIF